jgi:hypothetical protein
LALFLGGALMSTYLPDSAARRGLAPGLGGTAAAPLVSARIVRLTPLRQMSAERVGPGVVGLLFGGWPMGESGRRAGRGETSEDVQPGVPAPRADDEVWRSRCSFSPSVGPSVRRSRSWRTSKNGDRTSRRDGPGRSTTVLFRGRFLSLHPSSGANVPGRIAFPWPVAQMILQHHERLDGSGYPNRLSGEQILPEHGSSPSGTLSRRCPLTVRTDPQSVRR